MALTRKPRKGETLQQKMDRRWFDVGIVELIYKNLCYFRNSNGQTDVLIWKFRDGFNNLIRIKPARYTYQ